MQGNRLSDVHSSVCCRQAVSPPRVAFKQDAACKERIDLFSSVAAAPRLLALRWRGGREGASCAALPPALFHARRSTHPR